MRFVHLQYMQYTAPLHSVNELASNTCVRWNDDNVDPAREIMTGEKDRTMKMKMVSAEICRNNMG